MIKFNVNFGDTFQRLDRYADAVKSEVTMAGVAAGAMVFYDEVRARAPVSPSVRTVKGKTYTPGALRDSIYRAFAESKSTATRKVYEIGWNRRKAPHGHLLEFGTVKMAARPFLRPSLGVADQAIAAGKQRMKEKLLEIKL